MAIGETPFILLGIAGAVAITCFAFWNQVVELVAAHMEPSRALLQRAAIPMKAQELALTVIGSAVVLWALLLVVVKPASLLIGALLLVVASLVSFVGARFYISSRIKKRLALFNNQLEIALRLISGALRVGLGLRQALLQVVTDMPEPSRIEFSRVLSQTQIGVSIYDALDQLAERMPSNEIAMMTRSIRVQSQTGGNLGKVLDNLAETIKQRRKLNRKIAALTSEARFTKYIITALPIGVGVFIMIFQPDMREGLLETLLGRICLGIVVGLLVTGWLLFDALSRLDI